LVMGLILSSGVATGLVKAESGVSPPGDEPIGYACPDFNQNAAVYRPRTPVGTPALIGLPNGNTWVTPQPNFLPDRRPMVVINFAPGAWVGKPNTNPNGSLVADYVPDVVASRAANQFGLSEWWFGKHTQYPGNLSDVPSDTKSLAFGLDTHIRIPWGGETPIPLLQAGANSTTDQCDYLIATLDRYYADGFRRFLLFLPGGVPFGVQFGGHFEQRDSNGNLISSTVQSYWGGHTQPMNQWQLMPQWKQVELQSRLTTWLAAHQPVPPTPGGSIDVAQIPSVELYSGNPIGSDVNDPCVHSNIWSPNVALANQGAPPSQVYAPRWVSLPTGWSFESGLQQWVSVGSIVPITPCAGSATFDLDPREVSHLRYVWDALNPWRGAGINRFWLDTAADNENVGGRRHLYGLLELAYNPVFMQNNFRFGGEAFPVVNNGATVDECNSQRAPWIGLLDVCATTQNGWSTYTFKNWNWNRSTTEAVLWVNKNSSYRNLVEARQRGYVLACANNDVARGRQIHEIIKRLYGCGWIYTADFNGDGTVDLDDLEDWRWMAQVYRPAHPNIGINSFGFGDINDDGFVDAYDETTLLNAINQDITNTYSVPSLWVNFGVGQLADR
jgi:hypothetical protein